MRQHVFGRSGGLCGEVVVDAVGGVSPDRRPLWLALALFAAFAVVLIVPVTRTYFGLTAPDPPVARCPPSRWCSGS